MLSAVKSILLDNPPTGISIRKFPDSYVFGRYQGINRPICIAIESGAEGLRVLSLFTLKLFVDLFPE
ncbi:MAG: hypothetical protein ACD_77C00448G0001 [uncultured bacterium]|nr:MAG: hypothetical protein ACD_77C00448G0001 [uncultured bacterium]